MKLPNFLIVGAAKCGTTSLYHYLKQHPAIYMPAHIKETFFLSQTTQAMFPGPGNFYATLAIQTLDNYQKLFTDIRDEKAIGEACVAYLFYYEIAINRILQLLGKDVKIIICLRDPSDRAYSNYLHHVKDNIEPLSFLEAIEAENWRREAGWWWGFEYVTASLYCRQVQAYLDAFGQEKVLIILYDDLVQKPIQVLTNIFEFLEINAQFMPDISTKYNISVVPRNKFLREFLTQSNPIRSTLKRILPGNIYWRLVTKLLTLNSRESPKLSKAQRRRLIPKFRKDILKLQDLIQIDLSHWLRC